MLTKFGGTKGSAVKFTLSFCAVLALMFALLSCSWLDDIADGDADGDDTSVGNPPQKPTIISAVASDARQITVSWQQDDEAASYRLFYSTDSLGAYTQISSIF